MPHFLLLGCFIAVMQLPLYSQKIIEKDLTSHFDRYGVKGCFMLYNEANDEFIVHDSVTCDSGYIPASTFKIPHALIALEEKLVADTSQVIPWNGVQNPVQTWNQDQTLKTSLKYSCVWVYSGFAEKLKIDDYYRYVDEFDYGNKDLKGPTNRFWLVGSFRISARQQIEFLSKFYHYQLPVSERSVNMVKDCLVIEKTNEYTLSAKTGGGVLSDTDYVMWFVGYLERDGKVYFYAMNFRSGNFEKTASFRYEITKSILKELGLI